MLLAQSNHTVSIGDATNDFTANEALGVEGGFTTYLTWDANNMYIGINGGNPLVGAFTNLWVVIDTDPATSADPRSGNGLNTQPVNHSGGVDYPFKADVIFEFDGAGSNDVAIQSPASGRKWTVSGGVWGDVPHGSTQIRRHNSEITDLIIPFSETNIQAGSDFNIIIYLASTGASGTNTTYAQWPTNNPNIHAATDANGGNAFSHYYTFPRLSSISPSDGKYLSIRTYANGFTFSETKLANLALVGGVQTYQAGALTNIHKNLVINNGATFSMGSNTAALNIGNNIINNGSNLVLSSNAGGDLTVGGNWTFNNTTTFTNNNRQVTFNGTTDQTIVHNGNAVFSFFEINKTNGNISLENNIECTERLLFGSSNAANITTNNSAIGVTISKAEADDGGGNFGIIRNGSGMITTKLNRVIGTNTGARLFPLGDGSNYRPFTLNATTSPVSSGTVSLTYTTNSTVNNVSINDNGTNIILQNQSTWAVSTGTISGGNYNISLEAGGMTVDNLSDIRACLNNSVVGHHGAGTGSLISPVANRTGLSLTDLANTFYIGSINASSTLPVEWLSFDGNHYENGIQLKWATASEKNNDYFEIQKSANGKDFEVIGIVNGMKNSVLEQRYDFFDENPYISSNYYRLKQVDLAANSNHSDSEYSKTIHLIYTPNLHFQFNVYPNPVIDILKVKSPLNLHHHILKIHNSNGQLMYQAPFSEAIDVSNFAKGLYWLTIFNPQNQLIHQTKFVK